MGTKSTTVLTLNNPPLVEVACGVYFKNLDKLLIPHIGLLWEDFCGEFHRFEEYLPIQNLNNSQSTNPFIISSKPALPRIWFINENETSVLQIQRDLFMLNWRKTGNSDYPRFGKVYSDFKKYLETFKQFLVKNKLGSLEPVRFELGYINHIAQNQLWSKLNDLSQIFTVFNLINSTKLDESEAIGFDCLFPLARKEGKLAYQLRTAKKDDKLVLQLSITVSGLNADKSFDTMDKWFENAHDEIVDIFTKTTTNEIQHKVWSKQT